MQTFLTQTRCTQTGIEKLLNGIQFLKKSRFVQRRPLLRLNTIDYINNYHHVTYDNVDVHVEFD